MAICYLGCDEPLAHLVKTFPSFQGTEILEICFPVTATDLQINLLVTGPETSHLTRVAANISDWNIPPVALFILPEENFNTQKEMLCCHPRVGRSIFFCKNNRTAILDGLEQIHKFHEKRKSLSLDHSISGNYNTNNVSPRWLFQTMMEHLDEYIYFKDADSHFLAVSRYLAESCGKKDPADVFGLTDFNLFDKAHAEMAFSDERKIVTGKLEEIYKEEVVEKSDQITWVASRKLPLKTHSNYLVGTFGLSRDITKEKELHRQLEESHERMHSELLLARNLQSTLMQKNVPEFIHPDNEKALEVTAKYIPSFHLSGDFFSVVKTDEGNAAILIADVMGHGVRAAMVTAMIQIAVQQLNIYAGQPSEFMARLNDMMKRTMQAAGQTIFATAAYSYIDLAAKKLTYVQAGGRHGVYIPSSDSRAARTFKHKSTNPAIGLMPDIEFSSADIPLESGDEILLYTDGIIEAAMGEEEYSEPRMIDFLMEHRRDSLPDMLDALLDSVQTFTKNKDFDDDVCLVGLRMG